MTKINLSFFSFNFVNLSTNILAGTVFNFATIISISDLVKYLRWFISSTPNSFSSSCNAGIQLFPRNSSNVEIDGRVLAGERFGADEREVTGGPEAAVAEGMEGATAAEAQ